jgi:hypothetical protein
VSITALSPTNVWGAGFRGVLVNDRTVDVPVVEHWDGTSWSIVSSPNPNKNNPQQSAKLDGIAAISANDIWAVGTNGNSTLTEHWDGTRWRVINSPNPGQSNSLAGVTALSDGTVVAVGVQFSSTTGETPLILQNSWHDDQRSAQAPAATSPGPLDAASVRTAGPATAARTPTLPSSLDAGAVDLLFAAAGKAAQPLSLAGQSPTGTVAAAPNGTIPAPRDARALDLFFAAAGMTDQTLSLARHSSRAHAATVDGDLDVFAGDL